MVLLDDVQFPRSRGWMNRNRVKSDRGELWLTVPVQRKGRGLQSIRNVKIYNELDWRKKHLTGIRQNYVHAPFMGEYFTSIRAVYNKAHQELASLNLDFIRFFWKSLSLKSRLLLQSELGVQGKGTELVMDICDKLGAKIFLTFPAAQKYLALDDMARRGIEVQFINYYAPVYPQLWGDFLINLSVLDLLFNCGPRSRDIILRRGN
jgi:hypothetical protein